VILVPTDFSDSSNDALAYATDLAETFSASIQLLHVVESPLSELWVRETYGMSLDDFLADFRARGQKQLEKTVAEADRRKYIADVVIRVGSPFTEIPEYAKAHDVDLIVMATHGRGALERAALGSVAARVVRCAPCPVLTVRRRKEQSEIAA
jgi:nucleotide-binding universal stress UspA family protein